MSGRIQPDAGAMPGQRPDGPYWQDPVYRHVARLHRLAVADGNEPEAERLGKLMQQLIDGSMPDGLYRQLVVEAKAARRKHKQDRKRVRKRQRAGPAVAESAAPVSAADLKKRIFNPQVSRENVIEALEALPAGERRATIAGLPPGLRRKLGGYLKGRGQ